MKNWLIWIGGMLAALAFSLFSLEKAGRMKDRAKQAKAEAKSRKKVSEAYAKGEQEQHENIKRIKNTRNKRGYFTK